MLFSRIPTEAVLNANNFDTRDIEEGEIDGSRRGSTAFITVVTKLIFGTKIEHRSLGEKFARPFLEHTLLDQGE
jgi:hypothetical protein